MKIGVVGKGGTGKTTVSALVAQEYAARRKRVVAVDTDSNPNLAMSLGLDEQTVAAAPLLPRSLAIGADGKTAAGQLLADYGVATPSGVTLLHAMRVDEAGAGCTCAGHATVRSLLGEALEDHCDIALVDMEAGLEHLSRSGGTLAYVDLLLIVTEPTHKSLFTAARTITLAEELGIIRIGGVANKVRPEDVERLEAMAGEYEIPLAAVLPYDPGVARADRMGSGLQPSASLHREVDKLIAFVDSEEEQRAALLLERARLDERLAALRNG